MKFLDAMNRRARQKMAAGEKLTARFGIMSLVAAVLVMGYQFYVGITSPSAEVLAFASFGWFAVLLLGGFGVFFDDRRTFSYFGVISFFLFGLPLIIISSELLGML